MLLLLLLPVVIVWVSVRDVVGAGGSAGYVDGDVSVVDGDGDVHGRYK